LAFLFFINYFINYFFTEKTKSGKEVKEEKGGEFY
jgi:hypothetical protein